MIYSAEIENMCSVAKDSGTAGSQEAAPVADSSAKTKESAVEKIENTEKAEFKDGLVIKLII